MLASYHGHAPLVKLLIQHGADPNKVNDRGQTPLAGAVFKGESDVIEVSALLVKLRQPVIDGIRRCWKETRILIMALQVLWKR